jgi:3-oxoacyl-[acyl-carrier protein] reductase
MSGTLSGKVVIVTGAARNIGYHAAAALRQRDARLAIFGRTQETIEDAADKLGGGTLPVTVDLTDREAVFAAIARVEEHFGRIDGIVNNAGVAYPNKIENLDAAQLYEQVSINFLAAVHACQAVIPCLRRQGGGRIVNVSSATAHVDAFSFLSIYSATKAALERFTDELRLEVQADNIGVTIFIPGDTATGFGLGWNPEVMQTAYVDWLDRGRYYNGLMPVEVVGETLARCFDFPPNCAIETMMLRPVGHHRKVLEEEQG